MKAGHTLTGLIIGLLALPFIDLYVLIESTSILGFFETLALVLVTGLIGATLIRREGHHVLLKLQRSVTGGEVSRNMLEGGIIVFCGILLLTPGFISDLLGFLLIFRPLRERLVAHAMNAFNADVQFTVRSF